MRLGGGLLVAEIQQSSDTTWRLFDWNRLGPDGRPRALHIAEPLDAIDYSAGPVSPVQPSATENSPCERLLSCDQVPARSMAAVGIRTDCPTMIAFTSWRCCRLGNVSGNAAEDPLKFGETVLCRTTGRDFD